MGYLRRKLNYLERITLCDLAHMMSMANHIAIGVESLRIDSWCSLEKDLTESIELI